MKVRTAAVAGMFYPKEKNQLLQSIKDSISSEFGAGNTSYNEKIYGAVCPHAGYMYSGPVATHSFSAIANQDFELAIILGPNHWGIGCDIATLKDCQWESPLGNVEVDSGAAKRINEISKLVEIDFFSHTREHSIEVQIPMLQHFYKKSFKILPIALNNQEYEFALEVGSAVAKLAAEKKAIIIGSSDFTHYEENEYAHSQDKALIEPILEMDVDKFYRVLRDRRVTACGYGAIASTMVACKELGAKKGRLLQYATSGDVTGDKSSVVGYASIVFS
ncbi:MAG: MEMO1 family protein [Thermoproteota archaeon]